MYGLSVVSAVLWVLALAATVWVLAPAIAFALGIGGVRTDVLSEVGPPSISGDQATLDERLRELAALGFRDVGRTRQTGLFMLPGHWRWRQFETTQWLVGPDSRVHATLHRLIRDEPARISFVTVFDDGGVVRTTCPGTGHMPSLPNYRVTEIRGVTASELLAAHHEQVGTFGRDRDGNPRSATVAEITATTDAAEAPLMRTIGRGLYGCLLPFAPAALFFAGGLVTGLLSWPVVPLGICVAAAAYAFKLWMVIGPLRHVATRRTHVGDAIRELAPDGPGPSGPSPAGPADVAPDGTTAAMRQAARVLRAVAAGCIVLAVPGAIFVTTLPRTVMYAGIALITFQLQMTCVSAMVGLSVLRRERAVAAKDAQARGRSWEVLGGLPLLLLFLGQDRKSPQLFAMAAFVLVVVLVMALIPRKRGE